MEEERDELDTYMLEFVDFMLVNRESQMGQIFHDANHRTRDSREKRQSEIEEQKNLYDEDGSVTSLFLSAEVEEGPMFTSTAKASAEEERVAATVLHTSEDKQLVLLQINCRSKCNTILEFWNLIDTYKPDEIGTESWIGEEINNAEVFRDIYLTFRRNKCSRGGGDFVCFKFTSIAGWYELIRFFR